MSLMIFYSIYYANNSSVRSHLYSACLNVNLCISAKFDFLKIISVNIFIFKLRDEPCICEIRIIVLERFDRTDIDCIIHYPDHK